MQRIANSHVVCIRYDQRVGCEEERRVPWLDVISCSLAQQLVQRANTTTHTPAWFRNLKQGVEGNPCKARLGPYSIISRHTCERNERGRGEVAFSNVFILFFKLIKPELKIERRKTD